MLGAIFFFAFANFALSFLTTWLIGGDANSGAIENGRYLVRNGDKLNEVGAATYYFSLWQTRSLFVTHPMGLLAAFLASRRQARDRRGSN